MDWQRKFKKHRHEIEAKRDGDCEEGVSMQEAFEMLKEEVEMEDEVPDCCRCDYFQKCKTKDDKICIDIRKEIIKP